MTTHPPIRLKETPTIKLLKNLIKIPSVNPSVEKRYDEEAIASYIAKWFRKTKRFRVIEQKVDKNRFNVIAILEGKGNGKSLMLNGHMDTVGTSYMTVNPFHPTEKKGRIYGRGSCDMKGSLAAMMSATLALSKLPRPLEGDVIFTGVVDEEQGSKGTSKLVEHFRSDAAIVGEPTNLDIGVAHKGYAWLEVETIGREAHGSMPEQGIDAIEKMCAIVSKLQALRRQHKLNHPLVGTAKIHTSTISGGTEWSTIPGNCILHLERRLLPGETPGDAVKELRQLIQQASKNDQNLRAKIRLARHAGSMEVNVKQPLVQFLLQVTRRLTGKCQVVGVPYWTDAAILVNQARIPSCLFGPGDIKFAHSNLESIKARDVLTAATIYAATAQRYCNYGT